MNEVNIYDAVIKGLATSLRTRYPQFRIEGHPGYHANKISARRMISTLTRIIRPSSLLLIKDADRRYGLSIKITQSQDPSVLIIHHQLILQSLATKWKHWMNIDILRPDSLDDLEQQIVQEIEIVMVQQCVKKEKTTSLVWETQRKLQGRSELRGGL